MTIIKATSTTSSKMTDIAASPKTGSTADPDEDMEEALQALGVQEGAEVQLTEAGGVELAGEGPKEKPKVGNIF